MSDLKGIRYIVRSGDYVCGFLTALDDFFDEYTVLNLCWFFEDKLDCPDMGMTNTISYFTPKGNRTFHKAIKKCEIAYKNKGISFIKEEKEIDESLVLYKDEYQVICLC